MKKNWIKNDCLILGMSLLLTGCGRQDVPTPDHETISDPPTETAVPQTTYDNSLIEVLMNESGTFVDEFDQNWDYSFQIPQLISDSQAAHSINEELKTILGDSVSEAMNNMAEGLPPAYGTISWESHWNGSLVSLIVSCSHSFYSDIEYLVYHYDFASQERLDGPDLLDRLNIREDVFFDALRKTAAAEHDAENAALDDQYGDCYAAAAELRAQTISAKNLNWAQVKPYLDDGEVLTAIINRATYAGGGVYRTALVPDLNTPKQITKTVQCDYVSAELNQGKVTVTFHKTPQSDWYMPADGLNYDTPYPVEGLYGNYTDLFLGIMGQNTAPYLFLLDDQGRVSFCDIAAACHSSAPRFFAAGPLIGIEQAVSFETESTSDGQMMYVRTADEQLLSLFEYTVSAESALHNLMKPESSWCTEDGNFVLHIREDAMSSVSWSGGGGLLASGHLYYGGMTEDGLQYPFFMWTEEGGSIGGVLTLECQTSYTAPEGDNSLILHQYTGPVLSGIGEGSSVELYRVWSE